jgi:ABC-type Co2+ transport system permease subunit
MRKANILFGIVVGGVTASVGGLIRYLLALDKSSPLPFASIGIGLPYLLCFLMPIIGGFAGWIGAMITNKKSESKTRAALGGLLGGVVTGLIFIPYPMAL